ncbi:cation transporter [Arthrobacter sp. TMN-50]
MCGTKAKFVPVAGGGRASFTVSGLTGGSCVSRVGSAIGVIDEVTDVQIDLVAGGTSKVTVLSNQAVSAAGVRSAGPGHDPV